MFFRRARLGLRPLRRSYNQMQTAVRVSRSSFSRMCCTCFWTVRGLHSRIFAISRLRFPSAIHSTTSNSRFVKGRDSAEAARVEPGLGGMLLWRPFGEDMGEL